jgi:capsid assembly protease
MPIKHPLAEAVTANPLLIDPTRADLLSSALSYLAANADATAMLDEGASASVSAENFWGEPGMEHPYRPYTVSNGVLQIPVQGVLLNRFSYAFGRWATGYQYIEKALARGLADGNVRAIALVTDSPGGEVAGCFELADKIFEARGKKPIRAFAADHAYSAAYALASAASEIVVTRSGGTGSVGVVTAHVDYSEALANEGIKVTFIFAGAHKVDGNPYEALPDSVKSRMQERIDRIYGVFTSSVARNRGVDEKGVRATEALTFDAQDSVAKGFADRVGALDEEMVIFSDEVAAANEDETMTQFTQDQMDAAVASATASGREAGMQEGSKAAQTRITAILSSDEGKARPKAALALALKSGDNAETVIGLLADMPEEKAEAPKQEAPKAKKTPFEESMEASGNPNVGASDDANGDDGKADFATSFFGTIGMKPKSATRN